MNRGNSIFANLRENRSFALASKTGRFGPIGPETAQCQLPHNIVTFGTVRVGERRLVSLQPKTALRTERICIRREISVVSLPITMHYDQLKRNCS